MLIWLARFGTVGFFFLLVFEEFSNPISKDNIEGMLFLFSAFIFLFINLIALSKVNKNSISNFLPLLILKRMALEERKKIENLKNENGK
jgi:hypothetical protein